MNRLISKKRIALFLMAAVLVSLDASAQKVVHLVKRGDKFVQIGPSGHIEEDNYYEKDGKIYRIKTDIDTLDNQPVFEQLCMRFLFRDSLSGSLHEAIEANAKSYTPCSMTQVHFTHSYEVDFLNRRSGVCCSALLKRTVTTQEDSKKKEKIWRWYVVFDEEHGKQLTIDDILMPEEALKIKAEANGHRIHLSIENHGLTWGVVQQGELQRETIYFYDAPQVFQDSFKELIGKDEFSGQSPVLAVAEVMPSFPGGEEALSKYLDKNIRYPSVAAETLLMGRVTTAFVVEPDGSITDVKVISTNFAKPNGLTIDEHNDYEGKQALQEEAMRVIRMMPRWVPGTQKGVAIRVRYVIPIIFSFN